MAYNSPYVSNLGLLPSYMYDLNTRHTFCVLLIHLALTIRIHIFHKHMKFFITSQLVHRFSVDYLCFSQSYAMHSTL